MNDNNIEMNELLYLQPIEVDKARVYKKTAEKLGLSPMPRSSGARGSSSSSGFVRNSRKPRRRVLRALAIAAAFVVLTGSVAFAGYSALQLAEHPIDFFAGNTTNGTTPNTPTFHTAAMDLEQYNATVGQSVEVEGATVTLDTIAVDDNFINAFFTIAYDEPLDLSSAFDDYYDGGIPAYERLRYLMPWFEFRIDGEAFPVSSSSLQDSDSYLADERTVKLMAHYLIPAMIPDTFSLNIRFFSVSDDMRFGTRDEPYEFNLNIDKTNPARMTKAVEPGSFDFATADGVKPLNLEKLALTPFGGVFTVSVPYESTYDAEAHDDEKEAQEALLNAQMTPTALSQEAFLLTDNLGNTAYLASYTGMSEGSGSYSREIYGLSPEATSVTLMPLRYKWDNSLFETRSYAVSEVGQRIETSPLGGLVYDGCEIEGSRMTYRFTPYGYAQLTEVMPDDEGVTLTETKRVGLKFSRFDTVTGQFVYTHDYYVATEEELRSITTFRIPYEGYYELDTAAALTLPLQPVTK